jgi:hypothetical protein
MTGLQQTGHSEIHTGTGSISAINYAIGQPDRDYTIV